MLFPPSPKNTVYTYPLPGSTSMFPWSPGCTPTDGVVTSTICGHVSPPSNDFATNTLSVPASSTPSCLYVRYSTRSPCEAIHCRSTSGTSLENGFTAHVAPPLNDVDC